jgi:DNA polymerase (family 10)
LAHPTGRKINEREPLPLNMEKIFETAKKTDTFLEIDGTPKRMDLKDIYVKAAKEAGCKFSLGSDAHSPSQMEYLKFAVINARRGWLEKKDVLNCWSLSKIKKKLKI